MNWGHFGCNIPPTNVGKKIQRPNVSKKYIIQGSYVGKKFIIQRPKGVTNNFGNTGPEKLIRGGQIFGQSFYKGQATFSYRTHTGQSTFLAQHFMRSLNDLT